MLRQRVKSGLARALSGTGADRLVGALSGARRVPLVVGYHRVVEHFDRAARAALPGMVVSVGMLERHLAWLGRRFRFVPLDELGARLVDGGASSRPVAAVTFDDGYAEVHDHALPLLRRMGVPAAVFVVTDCVATGALTLYDRLHILLSRLLARDGQAGRAIARLVLGLGLPLPPRLAQDGLPPQPLDALRALLDALPRAGLLRVAEALDPGGRVDARAFPELRPMSWDEVRALQRAGITIGSHTRTHALLNREDGPCVRAEAAGSRQELERALGVTVEHFAYPDGRFDDTALEAVGAAGYRFAYTTCAHRDPRHPLLTIPRRMFWETSCLDGRGRFSGAVMSCQAAGLFDRLTRCAHGRAGTTPLGVPGAAALAG